MYLHRHSVTLLVRCEEYTKVYTTKKFKFRDECHFQWQDKHFVQQRKIYIEWYRLKDVEKRWTYFAAASYRNVGKSTLPCKPWLGWEHGRNSKLTGIRFRVEYELRQNCNSISIRNWTDFEFSWSEIQTRQVFKVCQNSNSAKVEIGQNLKWPEF